MTAIVKGMRLRNSGGKADMRAVEIEVTETGGLVILSVTTLGAGVERRRTQITLTQAAWDTLHRDSPS